MLNIRRVLFGWALALVGVISLPLPARGQPKAGYVPLAWSAPVVQTVSHVAIAPQPGFDTAETQLLVHTESANPLVIASQLRLGSEYIRLSVQRIVEGETQDGPGGWWEPAYVGYKLVSIAHHGVALQSSKTKWDDPLLAWEFKVINDARQHLRNGLENVGKTRSGQAGASQYVSQELNWGLAVVQEVLAVMP